MKIESQREGVLCAKALLTDVFTHVGTNTDEKRHLSWRSDDEHHTSPEYYQLLSTLLTECY